ncbi:MAG: RDD family protein [Actinomycetota bacterium]|nr:RDD family protein [Actinomycetota bacterium]
MVDRRDVASWLEGPGAQRTDAADDFPGRRLGLPRQGTGSVGRFGRRLVAVFIDWTMCQLVAYAAFGVTVGQGNSGSWAPLGIFAAENLLLLSTLGSTFGQRLLGLQLASVTGGRASVVQILLRTVLLCLAVPALIWDRDQRGLHDKAASTVLIRR